ncbi:leucyl aminopeptidase [Microbacterium sp. zg-YB36]|uniref:leucyl aminopeptidase n=1 Tax=Microbacterium sp. zg-YB36 TaxID=2969407 RepID=UPI00214B889D|nr:leucyl aminopeptidase [Microbacterium sp. zg-YB36]MDL5350264.1 leucyl aminopeptidase [Microbacterium sp. zg-YB36]
MPYPELAHSTRPLTEAQADALVLALPPLDAAAEALDAWPGLASALTALAFTGKPGTQQRVFLPEISDVPVIVVGTGADPDAAAVRDAVGAVVRTATGFATLAVAIPLAPQLWRAAAEGAVLGGYSFDSYKTDSGSARAGRVVLHTPQDVTDAELAAVTAIGDAAALVKDLVNTPADWQSPADLAASAEAAVTELPITVTVLDEVQMAEQGFGGILGVGKGSDRPPRFVRLDYAPAGADRHIALVGKGITFDTGGLSLKPATSMVGMKYDMCGAAVALAVVRAAAVLELPVRVSGWLCIADNMPSGRATRPGDVLRMLDGTTVEVLNTDAEGRLVMADGLVAASRERPDVLVDIATLTGAIIVALGTRHTGVMGEDAAVQAFLAAADRAGEPAWSLPLPEHMKEELDSPIADLQNSKIGDSAGGSMFAALFLQHFIGPVSDEPDAAPIPWVHLDIAGSGWNKGSGFGATDKGPTAAAVRSLIEFVAAGGR